MNRDERGAAIVLITIVLVVVVGMAAMVVGVGNLYVERRELQNGADAAALAVARDCAAGSCGSFSSTASTYADDNAADHAETVQEVCGNGPLLPACSTAPTVPAGALGYVKVSTSTDNPSNTSNPSQVKYLFAPVLNAANIGTTVHATAVVAWGSPGGLTGQLPLTFSLCEWNKYTSNGTVYAPKPPDPLPSSGYLSANGYGAYEKTIFFHDTTGASSCLAGPSGSDLPGGFGWLQTTTGCYATSDTTGWWDDKTGRPPPNSCSDSALAALVGHVIDLPVFDAVNGLTGTNGKYHMRGYAAFFLTGYSINGQFKVKSLITNQFPCSGQASCISGFFTKDLSKIPSSFGGSGMGVTIIAMTG